MSYSLIYLTSKCLWDRTDLLLKPCHLLFPAISPLERVRKKDSLPLMFTEGRKPRITLMHMEVTSTLAGKVRTEREGEMLSVTTLYSASMYEIWQFCCCWLHISDPFILCEHNHTIITQLWVSLQYLLISPFLPWTQQGFFSVEERNVNIPSRNLPSEC